MYFGCGGSPVLDLPSAMCLAQGGIGDGSRWIPPPDLPCGEGLPQGCEWGQFAPV